MTSFSNTNYQDILNQDIPINSSSASINNLSVGTISSIAPATVISMSNNVSAPLFIGNLQGNATSATNATNLTTPLSGIVSGPFNSNTIADGLVTDAMLAGSIDNSKLLQLTTAGLVANSATTADSSNVPNTIVVRNGSGDFSAGTITAALNGNVVSSTGNFTNLIVSGTATNGSMGPVNFSQGIDCFDASLSTPRPITNVAGLTCQSIVCQGVTGTSGIISGNGDLTITNTGNIIFNFQSIGNVKSLSINSGINGFVPIPIAMISNGISNNISMTMGRVSADMQLGVAAAANDFIVGSSPGDTVIANINNGSVNIGAAGNNILQANIFGTKTNGGAAVKSGSNNFTVPLGGTIQLTTNLFNTTGATSNVFDICTVTGSGTRFGCTIDGIVNLDSQTVTTTSGSIGAHTNVIKFTACFSSSATYGTLTNVTPISNTTGNVGNLNGLATSLAWNGMTLQLTVMCTLQEVMVLTSTFSVSANQNAAFLNNQTSNTTSAVTVTSFSSF